MALRAMSNKGSSLIELLVAMLIIMVSMLAFATSMTVSLRTSMNSDIRDTVTRVANQTGEALLALPFTDAELTAAPAPGVLHTRVTNDPGQTGKGIPDTVQMVRGFQQNCTIQWRVTTLSDSSVQVVITVGYAYQDRNVSMDSVLFKYATI